MKIQEILDLINQMNVSDRKKIKSGIKIPVVKKEKVVDNYKKEVALLFSVIQKNEARPIIENVLVKDDILISTGLDCSLFIPNIYNIQNGIYNRTAFETNSFQSLFDLEDFPVLKVDKEGIETKYNRIDLLDKLEKIIFTAAKTQENLSVNCIRFNKDKICSSDTYRLSTKELKSEFEYSLPLKPAKILINLLKISATEEVRVILANNQVNIFVDNYILNSRIIDLIYPPVNDIIEGSEKKYCVTIKDNDIQELFENLYKISKAKEEAKYSFEINFKNKKVAAIGDKNKFKKEIEIIGDVGFKDINLNSKFIYEYVKAHNIKNELNLELGTTNIQAVTINGEYIIMPLAMK